MKNDTESPAKKNITFWFGVIGTVAALIPLVLLWLDKKEAGVTCTIISADQLVPTTSVPKLSVDYQYNGKPVTNLWRAVLRVRNTGGRTLITTPGANKNVLAEGLTLTFPSARIFDYDLSENQPQVAGDITSGRTVLQLKFAQWRPQEAVKVSLYLSRESNTTFAVELNDREIVDGVVGVGKENVSRPRFGPLLSRVPPIVALAIGILGFEGGLVLALGLLIFLFFAFRDGHRLNQWWRDHNASWRAHLLRHDALEFIDSPDKAPDSVKAAYAGPLPPPTPKLFRALFGRGPAWRQRTKLLILVWFLICIFLALLDAFLRMYVNMRQ
ncbi:MAG TPA: hypothetical protein VGF13_01190 [Verrucomicrobiae bacterium]|jgi:hypothetical protein